MALEQREITRRAGEPISFPVKGCRLRGMVHHPPSDATVRDTGIILLNPGLTDRSGPQRLYVKLAERCAAEGYPVLRFDARGVGESDGEWHEQSEGSPIRDLFSEIQKGAWVPDAQDAIEALMNRTGVRRVILGGLCGGAVTALLAGADHPKVIGLFMLGTPVTLSSATSDVQDLPEAILARDATRYVGKLLSPSAWLRLVSFRTDYKTLWGVLASRFRVRITRNASRTTHAVNPKVNSTFLKAFESAISGGKRMMFVYSENDYLWQEFQDYLLPLFQPGPSCPFALVSIPHANHNITEVEWQERLNTALFPWVETCSTDGLPQRR